MLKRKKARIDAGLAPPSPKVPMPIAVVVIAAVIAYYLWPVFVQGQ
jgi:hypothetical protein